MGVELTEQRDPHPTEGTERRRRIRRTALLLALVAVALYVAFIVMSVTGVRT